nr:RHS domain-containing protein [Chthonobacter albigriseus]
MRTTRVRRDAYGRTIDTIEKLGAGTVSTKLGWSRDDRLVSVTDPLNNPWSAVYDALGRRTSVTEPDLGTRTFTYDAAGSISKDTLGTTATSYAYDKNGRLRTVTVGTSLKGTYTYDGFERLAVRAVTNTTPAGTTHFIHALGGGGLFDELMPTVGAMMGGLGNRVIAETDGAGVSLREYIWLGDQVMAVVADANAATPTIYWITNDHLGRPVQMTDAAKAVVWRASRSLFWSEGGGRVVTGESKG